MLDANSNAFFENIPLSIILSLVHISSRIRGFGNYVKGVDTFFVHLRILDIGM